MDENKVLLFEKHDGSFFAEIYEDDVPSFKIKDFNSKKISYDPEEFVWSGDYVTGKLISLEEESRKIEEIGLNMQCRNVIISEYPIDDQINNITDAILELAKSIKHNGPAVSKLSDQVGFIDECKATNQRIISAYRNDPYWTLIGEDDTLEFLKDSMKTMISEEIGVHTIDL